MLKGVAFGRTTHTAMPSSQNQQTKSGGAFQPRNSIMLNKQKTSDYKNSSLVCE